MHSVCNSNEPNIANQRAITFGIILPMSSITNKKKNQGKKKSKQTNSSRSGWIALAVVAAIFISMRFMNPNKPIVKDLSLTEFRTAVAAHQIEEVVRIRETDSNETFLSGKMAGLQEPFRVKLVPGENEDLMKFLTDNNINCPIKEKEPFFGPMMMQFLLFVIPFVIIYYIFFRKFSGAGAGGGMNPFSMGKSRAKLLNEEKGKPKVTFKDVAGIDEAQEEVQEIIEFLKGPEKFKKLGGRIPKGVLLVGPPGTGKTLLAKAIAGEAAVPFFSISGSDFEEMFVGVGASRVRDMFEQGKKNAPCLIFIDEIDSVGQRRSSAAATGGRYSNEQTLNAMLVEMDGFDANEGVIIIAATNRPDILDPALLRPGRFDRQIYIDLPTLKGREDILKLHGKKIKFAPDADISRLARGTPGFSGADLANVLNEAALLAARKSLDGVTNEVLEEARDKVLWGRERRSAGYSKEERERTAWHEVGHALLQLLLKNTDPLHKVTIIPRGRALGATMSLPEQDVLGRPKSWFLDYMALCCGGRIAEEMFTGDISTGAAQDIAQATQTARNMVCQYGMSERFGFQCFKEPNAFAVEEAPPPFSQKTAEIIDEEVHNLINAAYKRAKELIEENKDKLELLAKTLVEKESMDGRDVEKLLGITRQSDDSQSNNSQGDNSQPNDSDQPLPRIDNE